MIRVEILLISIAASRNDNLLKFWLLLNKGLIKDIVGFRHATNGLICEKYIFSNGYKEETQVNPEVLINNSVQ